MPRASPRVPASGVLALFLVCAALLLASCGPSDLSKAYDAYAAAVSPRLEAEARLWDQVAERANDQEDAGGTAKYRQYLAEKAQPWYVRFEADLLAVRPSHERLAGAHEQVVAFARSRREFVDLELRRIDLGAKVEAIQAVERARDAAEAARREYETVVGNDVPDVRFGTVNAVMKDFLEGKYERAREGSGDVAEAVDDLRKVQLPKIRELRDGRYDDTPHAKVLRRYVAATDAFLRVLADELPAIVDTVRSARRSETALRTADVHRTSFQQQLAAAKRDR